MADGTASTLGRFCWFELGTTDQTAAKKFYTGLFGWSFVDHPMGIGYRGTVVLSQRYLDRKWLTQGEDETATYDALARLHITETGWGMPLQLWVQAARRGLRLKEVGVPRVYLDPKRAFGGVLDNPEERLAYYRRVIAEAAQADPTPHVLCSTGAWRGMCR